MSLWGPLVSKAAVERSSSREGEGGRRGKRKKEEEEEFCSPKEHII